MFHNPGGDWHPGWGVDPNYKPFIPGRTRKKAFRDTDKGALLISLSLRLIAIC